MDEITFLKLQKLHDDLGRRLPKHRVTEFTHELNLLKSLNYELVVARSLPESPRRDKLVAGILDQLNQVPNQISREMARNGDKCSEDRDKPEFNQHTRTRNFSYGHPRDLAECDDLDGDDVSDPLDTSYPPGLVGYIVSKVTPK